MQPTNYHVLLLSYPQPLSYRDPQPQVVENYSYFIVCLIWDHFIFLNNSDLFG